MWCNGHVQSDLLPEMRTKKGLGSRDAGDRGNTSLVKVELMMMDEDSTGTVDAGNEIK